MKSIIFSLAACMALGSNLQKHCKSGAHKNVPKVHYGQTLLYPQELLTYIEEYCGHFEEFA